MMSLTAPKDLEHVAILLLLFSSRKPSKPETSPEHLLLLPLHKPMETEFGSRITPSEKEPDQDMNP